MPNANYIGLFGETIYDIALKLYGSVDASVKLVLDNDVELMDDFEGVELTYDTDYKETNVVPLVTIKLPSENLSQTYRPTDFQSIFDVALQLSGNLGNVVEIVHNSTLNNINTDIKITDSFNYTVKKSTVLKWISDSGIIFQTKTPIEGNIGHEFDTNFDRLAFN